MSLTPTKNPLELPRSLEQQLLDFRRRVWTIKLIEAGCGAAVGVLVSFLITFGLDRVWNTPAPVRLAIFVAAILCCALVPLALHRWVWCHRRLEQLARLLSRKFPSVGDQLLGVIELVRSESEQARSRTLCEAAIRQVAEQAQRRDFSQAVPRPRHRRWAALAVATLAIAILLLAIFPAAARNAWARFLLPWKDTPRYTFAMVDPLPDQLVVPHGEQFSLDVHLKGETVSHPEAGRVQVGRQVPVNAPLNDGQYAFQLPPLIDRAKLNLRVGDYTQQVRVEPKLRPELTSLEAEIQLPAYLGRTQPVKKDVRGGAITLVQGSRAVFTATASRDLKDARVDGQAIAPAGPRVSSPATEVAASRKVRFEWRDEFALAGKEPFTLSVNARDDDAPSLACDDLPRQRVILDTEQLTFKVRAQDDFGIKQVGIEWQGLDTTTVKDPAHGERIIAAGGPEKETMDLTGTFSAKALEIEPQPVEMRMYVDDYYPDRERVYSPTYVFYVLNAEQHAIWVTEQLSKWHRQSLEVRDREMQLHETNKQLRDLSPEELDQPDTRKRIEAQAAAERANGRRLSNLASIGDELVKQASRNPEIGVGHLEKWAEMLQILKDIAGNRMPSVADLLKEAAKSSPSSSNPTNPAGPQAGLNRASPSGSPSAGKEGDEKKDGPNKPPVPTISDSESSQQPRSNDNPPAGDKPSESAPRLTLPVTTLMGSGKSKGQACPAGQKLDEAVTAQQDLLAEFDKISNELNRVLGNLEGSTLVKRLKAAARLQFKVGGRIGDQAADAAGATVATSSKTADLFRELAGEELKSSRDVSNIMDDMQSYFERRRLTKFKTVLDDMRQQDVIGAIRQLSDDLQKENGVSMAQCDYWSDTMDRWAEDLVDPASGGT